MIFISNLLNLNILDQDKDQSYDEIVALNYIGIRLPYLKTCHWSE